MSLRSEYAALCKSIDSTLTPYERHVLDSAGITLFDIQPQTRQERLTGLTLVGVVLQEILSRDANHGPVWDFYRKIKKTYSLPNTLRLSLPPEYYL